MRPEEFLKRFSELSREDQEVVRIKIMETASSEGCGCPESMKEHLTQMMKQMENSADPMTMCREMMQMCSGKLMEKCHS